jgi:dynein heavy chain
MMYGGAPAGPAGTGKTETVKDLGRTLGIFVVVTNCSDEHKFRDMAKIFKGVCQSGLWGCFDEFNRISLPTLSVVAAQVQSITDAKKQKLTMFWFPNETAKIRLIHACAYFITMNPGYAGRQELPENLKVLFRGVTMMLPNRQTIMMVKLASVGYDRNRPMSVKFNVLYKLCEEQLSKTRHYDFGLRNILSVLRTAGTNKRLEKEGTEEEMIVARTLRDMNLSKFIAQDIPLFLQLLDDIFPKQKNMPNKVHDAVEKAVAQQLQKQNLQVVKEWKLKVIQLYETSLVRHGIMVVGTAGCGKTTIFNILLKSLTAIPGNPKYIPTILNPKAVTNAQLFGELIKSTGEWVPGILAEIWKRVNNRANKYTSWIVCDGPVDAIWIESMNTVLDDNKMLTLANAERIPMSDTTKMTFEVENLNNASPATVSRAGIIYVSPEDLSWRPLIETWCDDRFMEKTYANIEEKTWVREFVEKYMIKTRLMRELAAKYIYMMQTPEVVRTTMLLNLMHAVLMAFQEAGTVIDRAIYEKTFVYALAWSMGGLFETDDRVKFHKEILEKAGAPLP